MSGGDRDARWTCVVGPVVVVFFVIAPLTLLLPSSWTAHFVQYLPSTAGAGLFSGTLGVENPLPPWTGFAVMCAYAVVLIGLAAWRPHFAGLETDTAPVIR